MVASYIGGIAVFLIFASVVSLIAPQKKYKEYIDLIMAFGLILILITPIGSAMNFLRGASISDLTMTTAGVTAPNVTDIEQAQMTLVLHQFSNELALHLERIVDNDGQFSFAYSEFDLDGSTDNFGAINSITLWITERNVEPASRPFIRVERIEITPFTRNRDVDEAAAEDARIISLRNSISNFYHVRNEHINIHVIN